MKRSADKQGNGGVTKKSRPDDNAKGSLLDAFLGEIRASGPPVEVEEAADARRRRIEARDREQEATGELETASEGLRRRLTELSEKTLVPKGKDVSEDPESLFDVP